MPSTRPLTIATHDNSFHADDVVAVAILLLTLGAPPAVIRTRDPDRIARADIVVDVGGEYAPERNRFDHHQRGAPVRPDGVPYSSAGLVWESYGRRTVATLAPDASPDQVEAIFRAVERDVIVPLDRIDTGIEPPAPLSFARLVDDLNATWPEDPSEAETLARFLEAVGIAERWLAGRLRHQAAMAQAHEIVRAAAMRATEPRILELPRSLPFEEAVAAMNLDTAFVLYPKSGKWYVRAVPSRPGLFDQRIPLPERLAGLRDTEASSAAGIPGLIFVHNARFIAAAETREAALALARMACDGAP